MPRKRISDLVLFDAHGPNRTFVEGSDAAAQLT
jgi:hypothetical protein